LRQKIRESDPELQESMKTALLSKESRRRTFQLARKSTQAEAIDPTNIPAELIVSSNYLKVFNSPFSGF
jgi:hypothetical protein